jgi:hypothetical protein
MVGFDRERWPELEPFLDRALELPEAPVWLARRTDGRFDVIRARARGAQRFAPNTLAATYATTRRHMRAVTPTGYPRAGSIRSRRRERAARRRR